jgi:hypothetical protein
MKRKKRQNVLKAIGTGLASGLVASWVMNHFQQALSKLTQDEKKSHGAQSLQSGSPDHGVASYLEQKGVDDEEDNATERLASFVSVGTVGHELSKEQKDMGGRFFHYAFGATNGALYGAASEVSPRLTLGAGLPFGAAIWVVADEFVVPVLGLSKWPQNYPPSKHAASLASHLVYGLTTHAVFNVLRNVTR